MHPYHAGKLYGGESARGRKDAETQSYREYFGKAERQCFSRKKPGRRRMPYAARGCATWEAAANFTKKHTVLPAKWLQVSHETLDGVL
jgi:hypothetical protein